MKIKLLILLTFLSFSSIAQKQFEKIYINVTLETSEGTKSGTTYTKIYLNYNGKSKLKVVSGDKVYFYTYMTDPEKVIVDSIEMQKIIVSDKDGKLLYFYISHNNRVGSIFSDGTTVINYFNK